MNPGNKLVPWRVTQTHAFLINAFQRREWCSNPNVLFLNMRHAFLHAVLLGIREPVRIIPPSTGYVLLLHPVPHVYIYVLMSLISTCKFRISYSTSWASIREFCLQWSLVPLLLKLSRRSLFVLRRLKKLFDGLKLKYPSGAWKRKKEVKNEIWMSLDRRKVEFGYL